ncbi:intraflagellar transport protein 27 homolog isoform X1 [Polyodon spathula]|uniref:intraflagellar transport protein 27 homolog isoform X1 n=1 Tax=Polyodon spathula TaxID=7913 RepID=UPI001B7F2934|nr:intraflagellar transport protein 27 homolog isoform X1 [Polyodon spathula]
MVKLRARCAVAGDASVGKSALTQLLRSDGTHFQKNYTMTAGVEIVVKTVNIPDSSDSVELYLFDSAGKEVFADVLEKQWGELSALCLVFDITSEPSFRSCAKWLERVRAQCHSLQLPERDGELRSPLSEPGSGLSQDLPGETGGHPVARLAEGQEAKPAGTVPPLRAPATPAGRAPSKLENNWVHLHE